MGRILQVRDVPDDVYARLQERARAQGVSLAESVRASLVEQAKRPTMAEMLERLKEWEPVDPGESSADAIRAGRAERWPES